MNTTAPSTQNALASTPSTNGKSDLRNPMTVDLFGRVAVVTGSARGIGKAAAQALARNGATVVIADIDLDEARRTAAELPRAVALRMDVSDEQEVADGIAWIEERFQHIDILVNNAGVNTMHKRATIATFSTGEWDRIIGIDLRGVFLVSRAACRLMVPTGAGRIVNISSVLGSIPAREQSAFTAAKAAVNNLTRSMAIELAPSGILVNCIAPGSTLTTQTEQLFYGTDPAMSEKRQRLMAHVPLGRAGTTDEIARAILFFSAPDSSYITGQVLAVDGGWSAGGFFRDF